MGLVLPLLFVAVLGTSACGRTATSVDQPASHDTALVPGDFTALPRPNAATPIGEPAVDGRTTAQSFRVDGLGVQEVVDFYELQLAPLGWVAARLPQEVGDGDWQGLWGRGDESLQLSVSPYAPDDATTTQVDLVLIR